VADLQCLDKKKTMEVNELWCMLDLKNAENKYAVARDAARRVLDEIKTMKINELTHALNLEKDKMKRMVLENETLHSK